MSLNINKPTVDGEILSQPINDAFSQFIDNDTNLQSQITSHINSTSAHGTDDIINESSIPSPKLTGALNGLQDQVNQLVISGTPNATIGVYSFNTTGSNNAYLGTFAGIASLFSGLKVLPTINFTNTGASTFNFNSLGVKNIKVSGANGVKQDLNGGELRVGNKAFLEYDGTDWVIIDSSKSETYTTSTLIPETQVVSFTDAYTGLIDAEIGGATLNNQTKIIVNQTYAQNGTGGRIFAKTDGVVELGVSYNAARQTVNVKSGEKWFIMAQTDAKTLYGQGGLVYSDNSVDVYPANTPLNNLNLTYGIVTATKSLKANVFVNDNSAAVVATTKLLNYASINLSAVGQDSITADQCLYMINKYFEGFQGSSDVEIRADGNNLFDCFDKILQNYGSYLHANTTVIGSNKFEYDPQKGLGTIIVKRKVKKNTSYNWKFSLSRATSVFAGVTTNPSATGVVLGGNLNSLTNYPNGISFNSGENTTVYLIFLGHNTLYGAGVLTVSDIMLNEGSSALPYQSYKGKKLTIKCTNPAKFIRHKLPNGAQNEINLAKGYLSAVKRVIEYTLTSADVLSLFTSTTNLDYVNLSKKSDDKNFNNTNSIITDKNVILQNFKIGSSSDLPENAWNISVTSNTAYVLAVPKGTYANLAAAQAGLAGTKILYQLATPEFIPFESFGDYGIEVIGALPSFDGYTQLSMVSSDITPTVTYTYPMDLGAGVVSIQKNLSLVEQMSTETRVEIDKSWVVYTPTITYATANPVTPTVVAKYKKLGSLCYTNIYISSTNGNGATNATISLPLAPVNNGLTIPIVSQEKVNTTWSNPNGRIVDSTSNITFVSFSTATTSQSFELLISCVYEVLSL